jgi:peroxiredoxin
MRFRFVRLMGVLVLFLSAWGMLSAQISKMTPEKPKRGESVVLTYDPSAKGAKFFPGDEVFALYGFLHPDLLEKGWVRMERKDGLFRADLRIPDGAGFLTVYFITMDGWDGKADLSGMVYRKDGVPAEKAWHGKMLSDFDEAGYRVAFQNERRLYPANYSIYRDKWFIEGAFKKAEFKAIVGRDMIDLTKKGIPVSPGLLWALSVGYLHLDDEKSSRDVLRRMARAYPNAEETASALHDYDYQAFSKQLKGEGPDEINKLRLDLLRDNPALKSMREVLQQLAGDKTTPLDLILAVGEAWMKDEPDNPIPWYSTAAGLLNKGGELKKAAVLVDKALDLIVAGKLRFYEDISGSMTQFLLPQYMAVAAEIHEKLGDRASALAEIKAAQTLGKEVRAETFAREASIWRGLGFFKKAEEALLEARRRGVKTAEGELKELYRRRRLGEDGFDSWLATAEKDASPVSPQGKKPAPGFEIKTIDGLFLRLADLRGKVVVLNFWFVGCAPCRVEIPGLNKLVEEFASSDVVFIGLALDKADSIRDFLKAIPFKYQIAAEAQTVASQFGVSSYPTHVLINKQGEIEFFLIGGSPTRHAELKPLIQNLLK